MLYRCVWDGRDVLLKLYDKHYEIEGICRDIVVSTQMAAHADALKLLACCLETELPVLVFEGSVNKSLEDWLTHEHSNHLQLEWKDKLRIAYEVAYSAAYLHTAFSRPIVHRGLKPANVFLDQDKVAKLIDFSFCVSIPEGKTHLEDEVVMGTFGYIAPEYVSSAKLAVSSDVYSFGMLLLALFTEVSSRLLISLVTRALGDDISEISDEREDDISELSDAKEVAISKILGAAINRNGVSTNKELQSQLKASIELAFKCVDSELDNRPTMVDVAAQLYQVFQLYR